MNRVHEMRRDLDNDLDTVQIWKPLTSRRFTIGLIVWLACQMVGAVHANQDPLPTVRELYLSADYEGALAVLDRLGRPTRDSHPELADYRVLCLLALDRRDEARQAIRAIVNGIRRIVCRTCRPPRACRRRFRTCARRCCPTSSSRCTPRPKRRSTNTIRLRPTPSIG